MKGEDPFGTLAGTAWLAPVVAALMQAGTARGPNLCARSGAPSPARQSQRDNTLPQVLRQAELWAALGTHLAPCLW